MNIQLSDHFNCRRLLRFTLPSIVMMIFTSVYGVVDGFFVSNFVGKTSFAAVNFIMPFLMILGAVGFMFGAGGGALIAKTMGEGRHEKAQKLFSLFVYVTVICGIVIAVLGSIFIRPIAAFSWGGGDDAGRTFCGSPAVGAGGRSRGDCCEPVSGRRDSVDLFWEQKHKPSSSEKMGNGWKGFAESLHKWFF